MTYTFFNPLLETCEALKSAYRKLAQVHHPDAGGTTEAMQKVNAEFEELFGRLKNIHVNSEGETYTKATTETANDFMDIIDKIIHFENVTIEIIGSFIWCSGNTKPYKETLKELSFKWSSNKTAWYLPPEGYRKRGRKPFGMDEIREMFGSEKVPNNPRVKLA